VWGKEERFTGKTAEVTDTIPSELLWNLESTIEDSTGKEAQGLNPAEFWKQCRQKRASVEALELTFMPAGSRHP
jgi:hypothetical protein